MLEVLYQHAKFGGARISPAAGVTKNVEFFCLFVCLSITLLNVILCARFRHEGIGVQKKIWMPLDRERFVVVHPYSTF